MMLGRKSGSWVLSVALGPFISNALSFSVPAFVLAELHGFSRRFRLLEIFPSFSSSSSATEMIPAGIAIVSSDDASIPASWQKIANCLNTSANGKVATLSSLNLIRFVNPSPQNSSHPFPSVRLPQVYLFFRFEVCV
jgi:hypothetical protein